MISLCDPGALEAAIEHVRRNARDYGADLARWRADPDFANIAVRASADGRLAILSYTDRAQYEGVWTPLERACRGLVVETSTGAIVARPFGKFYNWGELDDDARARLSSVGIADVTTKEDGSLGVLFHHDGEWHAATRGAFDSPQARWAERTIREHIARMGSDCLMVNSYTYLVEIIHPQNRVVIDYRGRAGLILLAAIGRHDGCDLPREEVERVARWAGLPVVGESGGILHDLGITTLPGILINACEATDGCEGWVARFTDGTRVKFKTKWYLDLHRILSGFNAERVREAILAGRDMEYARSLPEEFWPEFDRLHGIIGARVELLTRDIASWHDLLAPLDTGGREGRAAFARAVVAQVPDALRGHVFGLHDGKGQFDRIVRGIDISDLMPMTGGFSSWQGEG